MHGFKQMAAVTTASTLPIVRADVPAARVPTVVATITEDKRSGCETAFGR